MSFTDEEFNKNFPQLSRDIKENQKAYQIYGMHFKSDTPELFHKLIRKHEDVKIYTHFKPVTMPGGNPKLRLASDEMIILN